MNDSIKRISLDIHRPSSNEVVNVKRGDTARTIHISLVEGGVPYIIGEDCYAVFTAKKPDSKVVYNDCTIENNAIIYEVTEQTVSVKGRVNSEIKLYGADGKLITSPKFTILVYDTVYDDGDKVESSDEFSALTSLVSDTQKAVKEAQDAIEVAQEIKDSLDGRFAEVVTHTPQDLTEEQKAQARKNIGAMEAGASLGAVLFGSDKDRTEIVMAAEAPDTTENGYIKSGRVSFYATDDDQPVVLGHLSDGVYDDDAATVKQLKMVDIINPRPLTEVQKAQARANIGIYGQAVVTDEKYFTITDDGVISLMPEYRGKGSESYPYGISDNGKGVAGSKNAELPSVIVIPDIVNEIAVTELAEGMFYGNEAIESLTIPVGITKIPTSFCREAKRLVEVHGTENVTELGKSSFAITRLKRAIFPNLTTMISTAFYRCVYLVVADIGNHIDSVKMGTFNGCQRLSFIRGGGAINKVEKNGLVGTYRLKNLPFAGQLTTIGDNGIYMSRVNYDWHSHECDYGTNATPKQLNPTDFWSGKTFTPCENPLRSTFHQENPEWDKDVREDKTIYNHRCGAVVCATIYSALEDRDIRPADFQRDVEAIGTEQAITAAKEIAYSDRQVECFRLLGYTVNGSNDPDAPANWYRVDTNLQLLYDSLAAGHLVGLEANDGTGGNSHIVVAYGINKDGEIMVVNSSSLSEEFGDYTAIKYCMPIQNLVRAAAGANYGEFMVVERKN